MWELNNTLLNSHWVKKKKEIKKYFETNKNRNKAYQYMGCNQKSVLKKKIVVKNIKKKERTQIT